MIKKLNIPNAFELSGHDGVSEGDEQAQEAFFNSDKAKKDARRLLGLDVTFNTFNQEDKDKYLVSEERKRAFENISTTTMPPKPKAEQKRGIVSQVVREQLISEEILKNYPIVYLGSGTDIEYPLALGGRRIEMVDYLLKSPEIQKELTDRIKSLINQEVTVQNEIINFEFDFGSGPENVTVQCKPIFYGSTAEEQLETETYNLPDKIGVLLSFAAQGPSGRVEIGEDLKSRLVKNGVILMDRDLTKIDSETNQEVTIELGERG